MLYTRHSVLKAMEKWWTLELLSSFSSRLKGLKVCGHSNSPKKRVT